MLRTWGKGSLTLARLSACWYWPLELGGSRLLLFKASFETSIDYTVYTKVRHYAEDSNNTKKSELRQGRWSWTVSRLKWWSWEAAWCSWKILKLMWASANGLKNDKKSRSERRIAEVEWSWTWYKRQRTIRRMKRNHDLRDGSLKLSGLELDANVSERLEEWKEITIWETDRWSWVVLNLMQTTANDLKNELMRHLSRPLLIRRNPPSGDLGHSRNKKEKLSRLKFPRTMWTCSPPVSCDLWPVSLTLQLATCVQCCSLTLWLLRFMIQTWIFDVIAKSHRYS